MMNLCFAFLSTSEHNLDDLGAMIRNLQERLNRLVASLEQPLTHPQVLKLNQELDQLVAEYTRLRWKNK